MSTSVTCPGTGRIVATDVTPDEGRAIALVTDAFGLCCSISHVVVTTHDDEITLSALAGNHPTGPYEYDVVLFDAEGFSIGEPGYPDLETALYNASLDIAWSDMWIRAEVLASSPPIAPDWERRYSQTLATITRPYHVDQEVTAA